MSENTGAVLRRRSAGIVFLLVPALLVWLAVAVYDKRFTRSDPVVVETGTVGNEMHLGAEVKLRGVVVGEVRAIDATGSGARLTLAMKPGTLAGVPADVRAQMLPTTLFGERFVALVPPKAPSGEALAAGAVIAQDRSSSAVELQQVLDNVLPMLTAVQPQKLSATLSAVSRALEGRGEKLGDTLTTLDTHLAKFNPHLPALNRDLRHLVEVSHVYADAAPDILTALTDFTTTSSTLAEQEGPARRDLRRHHPHRRGPDRLPAAEPVQHHPAQRHRPPHPGAARRVLPVLPLHLAHPGRVRPRHGQGARQGHRPAGPHRRGHHGPLPGRLPAGP
ncbi:hypothetical protein SDIAM26S_00550 [Streptomyces diastaticus subsp. diastaticus]